MSRIFSKNLLFGLVRFFLLMVLAGALASCFLPEPPVQNDLALAEAALKKRDLGEAEMYFERYLRKNPNGEQRWRVWQQLLDISLNIRQDKPTAISYLEIMLTEFAEEAPKRRNIQMQLAVLCEKIREYDRAVNLWEILAKDPGTPNEDRAAAYRFLSQAYLRRLEFSAATEVLNLCLKLDVLPGIKAECLYALAETRTATEELTAAEEALRALLRIEEIPLRRRVLGVFMLADVLEQRGMFHESLELYESIRESYPNTRVVEIRIASLKGKQNGKRDMRR